MSEEEVYLCDATIEQLWEKIVGIPDGRERAFGQSGERDFISTHIVDFATPTFVDMQDVINFVTHYLDNQAGELKAQHIDELKQAIVNAINQH